MHFAIFIPDWNSLESVRRAHSELEAGALLFFALLVLFDVWANLSESAERKRLLEKIGLFCFAVAVLAEIVAYSYGQRNDVLSEGVIGSLDAKAKEAGNKADDALAKSSTALSQAKDALSKTGAAEGAMKRAEGKALDAQKAASDAMALASAARREAASFERDIVSAKKQAAEAESHLIEALKQAAVAIEGLQRLKAVAAPRVLTLDQQQQIAKACEAFRGHIAYVSSYATDGEAATVGGQILATLQASGIDARDNRAACIGTGSFDFGIHIRGPNSEDKFISCLAKALRTIGELYVWTNDPPPKMGTSICNGLSLGVTSVVQINIGTRPVPLLQNPK